MQQTYENLCKCSKQYSSWTAANVDLAAAVDPWGGVNAVRMNNNTTDNESHRAYISGNTTPTASPFFVVLYVKGTASTFLVKFSGGSALNVSLLDGSEVDSTDAAIVSADLIGNGWRRVVIQCDDSGSDVLQLIVDAPGLIDTFAPASTALYADIVVQITNDSDTLPVHTTGTAAESMILPAGDGYRSAQLDVLNAINAKLATGAGVLGGGVAAGGDITLYAGTAHTIAAGSARTLTINDPGEVIKDRLQSADSLAVGLRRTGAGSSASEIEGTVDGDDITHDSETVVTSIPLEFVPAATDGKAPGEFEYDVTRYDDADTPVPEIRGTAILKHRNES